MQRGFVRDVLLKASKRGRPAGIKPSEQDLEILWQVHIWMTWPQYRTRSFDQLVRWAGMIRPMPAAHRTTLPNQLKRLHAAIAAHPKKFGFPRWVSRLPVRGRRVKTPKQSGAAGAGIRKGVRALVREAEAARDFLSQTRPRDD
jgi:hypothetical protein